MREMVCVFALHIDSVTRVVKFSSCFALHIDSATHAVKFSCCLALGSPHSLSTLQTLPVGCNKRYQSYSSNLYHHPQGRACASATMPVGDVTS